VNKDQIFWVVWGVVVLAGVVFYFTVVGPTREENQKVIDKKNKLAARFRPVTLVVDGKTSDLTKEIIRKKPLEVDKEIFHLYPLDRNLRRIPSDRFVKAKKEEDGYLHGARQTFVDGGFKAYSFLVNPQTDFHKPPEEGAIQLFRQWVADEDKRIDKAFREAAGGGIEMTQSKRSLDTPGAPLTWLDDGAVTGFIEPRNKVEVLRRLVLRRQFLLAVARAKASVPALKRKGEGEEAQDVRVDLERRVERITSLSFSGGKAGRRGKLPYEAHRVRLEVSCHLAVAPALLRELEAIGSNFQLGSGKVDGKRPFTFWADTVYVRRPMGWPSTLGASGEVHSGNLGSNRYGRYLEWPVTVLISGVVPAFRPNELDPAPGT